MAISVVGVGLPAVSATVGGTLQTAWPSGYTALKEDWVLFVAGGWSSTNVAPPTPSGYTAYGFSSRQPVSLFLTCSFAYRSLLGGESAPSITVPSNYGGDGTTTAVSAFVIVFRGVDYAEPNGRNTTPGWVASNSAAQQTFQPTGLTTSNLRLSNWVISAVTTGDDNALNFNTANSFTLRASGATYDYTTGQDHSQGLATKATVLPETTTMPVWNQSVNASDSWAALSLAIRPSSYPTNTTGLTATANAVGGIALSWVEPNDDRGSYITDYDIYISTDNSTYTLVNDGVSAATSANVTGLANNTLYYFRVRAVNYNGDATVDSNTASATTWNVPGAPTGLTATPNTGGIALSWTAPASNGGTAITDYVIQQSLNNSTWTTITDGVSTATSYNVTGLSNATLYYYRVFARNAVGDSAASNTASATTWDVPGSVTSLTGTNLNTGSFSLSWTAPASNGGTAITDYIVQQRLTGSGAYTVFSDGTSTATSATVTGLNYAASYDFQVAAVNARGTGAFTTVTVRGNPNIGWGVANPMLP